MKKENNYDKIGITNDVMFGSVFCDSEKCKELLQRILQIEIKELMIIDAQRSFRKSPYGKLSRLDVYAEDYNGNYYDVEMQVLNTSDLSLRSRFYHCQMDSYQIRNGKNYKDFPKSIVIFICLFDPFESNRSIYSFEKVCLEDMSIKLNDRQTTVFVNLNGMRAGIPTKTARLFDYFKTGIPTDEYTQKLQDEVEFLREDDDWRTNYMTIEMKMEQQYDLGMEKGMEKGRIESIAKLLKNGTEEDAVRLLDATSEEIDKAKARLNSI